VDSRRRGAFDRNFEEKDFLFVYLFLPSVACDLVGRQKLDQLQNSTLFIYIFFTPGSKIPGVKD